MTAWDYHNRWALVTGASAGIGEAFARELARRGMHLVLTARRADRLHTLAEELASRYPIQTAVVPADLAEPGEPARLWGAATEGRAVHLLVNNAGFGLRGPFADLPRQSQADMVRVNCTALLELAHLALPALRERGAGGIVNVASIAAYQPVPQLATYAATKAFVLSLSEALHEEMRGSGVRVLALCPGPVPTEFQQVAGTSVSPRTLGYRTANQVVEAALTALEDGERTTVPGAVNRLGTVAVRWMPRSVILRTAKQIMQTFR